VMTIAVFVNSVSSESIVEDRKTFVEDYIEQSGHLMDDGHIRSLTTLSFHMLLYVAHLTVHILLFSGLLKGKHKRLLPWLVLTIVFTVKDFAVTFFLHDYESERGSSSVWLRAVSSVLFTVIRLYLFMIIYSVYLNIRDITDKNLYLNVKGRVDKYHSTKAAAQFVLPMTSSKPIADKCTIEKETPENII